MCVGVCMRARASLDRLSLFLLDGRDGGNPHPNRTLSHEHNKTKQIRKKIRWFIAQNDSQETLATVQTAYA